jgi:hypothetical protein
MLMRFFWLVQSHPFIFHPRMGLKLLIRFSGPDAHA